MPLPPLIASNPTHIAEIKRMYPTYVKSLLPSVASNPQMNKVTPLACTMLPWPTLELLAGSRPQQSAINANLELESPATQCAVLGLRDPKEVLMTCGKEMEHFMLSFHIATEKIDDVIQNSDVNILKWQEDSYVVSGTIRAWYHLVVNGLKPESTTECREILASVYAYLRDSGFADMFSKYEKRIHFMDKTMVML